MLRLIAQALAVLAAVLPHTVPNAHAQGSARPNIVLIMADDMGYETIGAYGGTSYLTPKIDRLAAEGVRFEHAFSQPLCTPSRVQIMTGKYNVRNYDVFGLLPRGQVTHANLLKQAGYTTFIGGKWQLSKNSGTPFDDPVNFGFDEYFLWQLDRRPRRYYQPGFEAFIPSAGWDKQRVDFNTPGAFGPDLVVDQINAFITRNQAAPFFVYYPMMLPHDPFLPTPDHPNYNPNATTEPNSSIYFRSMAEYTDKMVGRVIDHIESLGLTSNTLVIFTADNGTLSNIVSQVDGRGVRGGKGATTNAGTRVPFIARWPDRFSGGRVSSQLVDFSDVLPTILEAAGEPIPAEIDGFSLLPELENSTGTGRNWSYLWYQPQSENPADVSEYVRDARYKLYRTGAFYDVDADPLEASPLVIASLSGAEQAAYATLAAALASFDDEVADRTQAPRLAPDRWDTEPQAGEQDGKVIMTAAAATDANGPLEYQFRNTTTNAVGDWTFGRSHEVDALAGVAYLFEYRTRDLLGNVSAWSASAEVQIGSGPSLRSTATGTVGGSTSSDHALIIDKPSGVQPGDLLIASMFKNGDFDGKATVSSMMTPAGWIQIHSQILYEASTIKQEIAAFYRIADGSESSSFSFNVGNVGTASNRGAVGAILALSGVDVTGGVLTDGSPGGPFAAVPGKFYSGYNNNATTSDTINVTSNAAALIAIGGAGGSNTTWSNWLDVNNHPLTEVAHQRRTGSSISMAWRNGISAGDTRATANLSSKVNNTSLVVALKVAPVITTSGSLSELSTTYGTASSASSFTVSGANMSEGITITPPAGFEVSTSSDSGYANSIVVGSSGAINSTTVYVRLKSNAAVGSYSGNITLTSTGATSETVATVSSTVSVKELTITAEAISKNFGDSDPNFTYTSSGLVGSDTISGSLSRASGENVGTYAINQGTLSAGSNYSISYTGANLTINAKSVTVTLTRNGNRYTASATGVSSFTYSYSGRNSTVYGPTAEAPADSGDYTVTATLADPNYSGSASEDFTVTALDHPPFRVTDITMQGTQCTITWDSQSGAAYTVEASTDPTDLRSWSAIVGSIASQGSRTTVIIDIATTQYIGADRWFVRIKANY